MFSLRRSFRKLIIKGRNDSEESDENKNENTSSDENVASQAGQSNIHELLPNLILTTISERDDFTLKSPFVPFNTNPPSKVPILNARKKCDDNSIESNTTFTDGPSTSGLINKTRSNVRTDKKWDLKQKPLQELHFYPKSIQKLDKQSQNDTPNDTPNVNPVVNLFQHPNRIIDNISDAFSNIKINQKLKAQLAKPTNDYILQPVYNILLLGETGTGKSTFINALANYMQHDSFDKAQNSPYMPLIPAKFTLTDPNTHELMQVFSSSENYDAITNERFRFGSSSTQSPVEYSFRFKDVTFRIIDTPGIGDTGGGIVDKENFSKIFSYLHRYKHLHGIVILFKADDNKITPFFCYCISELFVHLPKSACQNIMFCFTFSRNTFYETGSGFNILQEFLCTHFKENFRYKMEPGKNCFFVDNEICQFLVEKSHSIPFDEQQEGAFRESWNKSFEQIYLMFYNIKHNNTPYDRENITLLHSTSRFLYEMAQPMVLLLTLDKANDGLMETSEGTLKRLEERLQELKAELLIKQYYLEVKQLTHLRTVCTAEKCTEVLTNDEYHYKSICHDSCACLTDASLNLVGASALKKCTVFNGDSETCSKCECSWQMHMHTKDEQTKRHKLVESPLVLEQIKETEAKISKTLMEITRRRKLSTEYKNEYEKIQNILMKFACIRVKNSISPINRHLESYLDFLMKEELQKKLKAKKLHEKIQSRKTYESLSELKQVQRQIVIVVEKAIANYDKMRYEKIYLDNILVHKYDLLFLEHTGNEFQQIIDSKNWTKHEQTDSVLSKTQDLDYKFEERSFSKSSFWKQMFDFK